MSDCNDHLVLCVTGIHIVSGSSSNNDGMVVPFLTMHVLRAVDRFALSIDCSARTIDLSFAHQSIDRATIDGSRNKHFAQFTDNEMQSIDRATILSITCMHDSDIS
jgi:hypothetical protein